MLFIDFGAVRDLIPVTRLLERLGWRKTAGYVGGELRGPCPLHGSTGRYSRSFSVGCNGRGWYCHKCMCGGDVIDLYARVHQLDVHAAAQRLCWEFGHDVPSAPRNRKRNG